MEDLKNRLSKARSSFMRLKKIWRSSSLSRRTKLKLFRNLVVPVLAYGCATWKMNKRDNKMLNTFQNKCLRKIIRVRWEDHRSTEELLERANDKPLSNEVKRRKWKMIGHIVREERNNITNVAMTWASEGKRKRGRPKTTWHQTVEKERNEIGWRSWEEARMAAARREKWRKSVKALCGTCVRGDRNRNRTFFVGYLDLDGSEINSILRAAQRTKSKTSKTPYKSVSWMTVHSSSLQTRIVNQREGCMTRKNSREFYMPAVTQTNLLDTLVMIRLKNRFATIDVSLQY